MRVRLSACVSNANPAHAVVRALGFFDGRSMSRCTLHADLRAIVGDRGIESASAVGRTVRIALGLACGSHTWGSH
ncbi:hypothetical protein D7S86_24515 [Pararobbsia silviterrae]|uniref:Uncharacterized protein n=1 Tax=Pararobbsia silviterrae TaxID=1792498 RepID=A0A494X7H5_9BURK|nr:hypothetical protein D7S86_24515 [Pararobbsia silviterrae]